MEAFRCDTCRKVSPDEEGRHIANHWAKINVKSSRLSSWREGENFHICEECLPLGGQYRGDKIKGIVSFLKRKKTA